MSASPSFARADSAFGVAAAATAAILSTPLLASEVKLDDPVVAARTGDPVPGTSGDIDILESMTIGPAGLIAITGRADTGGVTFGFLQTPTMTFVAGDPAPGLEDLTFDQFEIVSGGNRFDAQGRLLFSAVLGGASIFDDGVVYLDDVLQMREGQTAPGIQGRTIQAFRGLAMLADGRIAGTFDLNGNFSDDSALIAGDEVLYREGDAVSVLPGNTWDANFQDVRWNSAGDVIFEGNIDAPSGTDRVVLVRRGNGASLTETIVLRTGDVFPELGSGVTIGSIADTAISENGQWAAVVTFNGVSTNENEAVVTENGIVVREGDIIDVPGGARVLTFQGIAIDDAGEVFSIARFGDTFIPNLDDGLLRGNCLVYGGDLPIDGNPVLGDLLEVADGSLMVSAGNQVATIVSYDGIGAGGGGEEGDAVLVIGDPVIASCPADLDGDNVVGFSDLVALLNAFGPCEGACAADFDGNNTVDFADLVRVLNDWGSC